MPLVSLSDPITLLLVYIGIWIAIFLIGWAVKADKFGVIVKPYYFMLKTEAFNSWMKRLGNRWRKDWLAFYDIGAAMGIGLSALAFYFFVQSIALILKGSPNARTGVLVPLPGVTISWEIFPYLLIAIAVLLIPHEAAHGIASVLDNVPIKSSGVFMALFLPGGFVEIDEEDLAKRANRTKLRVFAAGSFTNIVTTGLIILLVASLFAPTPSGVVITGLVHGGGAETAGVQQWSVLTAVNGTRIDSTVDLAMFMSRALPNRTLSVQFQNGEITQVTTKGDTIGGNQSRAVLGIYTNDYFPSRIPVSSLASYQLFRAFSLMILILPSVAAVNMLPLFPFDGDRYFSTLLNMAGIRSTKWPRIVSGGASLGLLVLSLILSYLKFGTIFFGI